MSLTPKGAGLVAGNVTGGGGKATKKRPNGTGRENADKASDQFGC